MADYEYVNAQGLIVADVADVQADIEGTFREAFGAGLALRANTPQGVLITSLTNARQEVARQNAAVANQINPDQAEGVFLDALWRLTGGERSPDAPSIVPGVTVSGVANTLIPLGSRARVGESGPEFESMAAVLLGPGGSATVDFRAVEPGPTAVAAHALNRIASGVLGWETVDNTQPAVPGRLRESDTSARRRRNQTLAKQGTGFVEAILSDLYAFDGIRSAVVRENYTSEPLDLGPVVLVPHSIYVCVDGATDIEVAEILLANKSLGCNWNGETEVTLEGESGQPYDIKFQRPTEVPIYMTVTVRANGTVGDPVSLVQEAILSYAGGGQEGENGFEVGGDVSPFEISAAINRDQPQMFVQGVTIGTAIDAQSTASIAINIKQKPLAQSGLIAVNLV